MGLHTVQPIVVIKDHLSFGSPYKTSSCVAHMLLNKVDFQFVIDATERGKREFVTGLQTHGVASLNLRLRSCDFPGSSLSPSLFHSDSVIFELLFN